MRKLMAFAALLFLAQSAQAAPLSNQAVTNAVRKSQSTGPFHRVAPGDARLISRGAKHAHVLYAIRDAAELKIAKVRLSDGRVMQKSRNLLRGAVYPAAQKQLRNRVWSITHIALGSSEKGVVGPGGSVKLDVYSGSGGSANYRSNFTARVSPEGKFTSFRKVAGTVDQYLH